MMRSFSQKKHIKACVFFDSEAELCLQGPCGNNSISSGGESTMGMGFLWNLPLKALAKARLCSLRPGRFVDTACWVTSAEGPSFLFVERTLEIHRRMHHALSLLKTFWPHNSFCSSPAPCREVAIPTFSRKENEVPKVCSLSKCVQPVRGRGWT